MLGAYVVAIIRTNKVLKAEGIFCKAHKTQFSICRDLRVGIKRVDKLCADRLKVVAMVSIQKAGAAAQISAFILKMQYELSKVFFICVLIQAWPL